MRVRRVAIGFLASGALLFTSAGLELTGVWSMVAAGGSLTLGAVLLAIAMEQADLSPAHAVLEGTAGLPDAAA